ncbi:MAG: ATP synthase F1 subunit epsilon [Akkermansia sp.]
MPLQFKIITPMRTAVDAEVLSVHLIGAQGEMEVLPGHTDLISCVANGALTYRLASGESQNLFVGGGFLQVENDEVLLVTNTALDSEEIDTDSVEQAIARAQEALRNKASVLSREETTYLEASIARQMAMLDYKKQRR